MKERKRFREKSIEEQLREIVVATIILFSILCFIINSLTKMVVYSNAEDHTRITAIRLRDQIELNYDKIKNYCISIGEDEAIRQLMSSSIAQMSDRVHGATECLTHYKILEPTLEDISLVNDSIHYSSVYSYESLDEIRRQVDESTFQWVGIRAHDFARASEEPDMLVYAGDIIQGGENLGTVILSLNVTSLQIEGESEMHSYYFLGGPKGVFYPFNSSEEKAREIWDIWEESGGKEALRSRAYDIQAYYLEDMGCYLVSALSLSGRGMGLSQIQVLIWGCVILAIFFCIMFSFIINRGLVKPLREFGGTIRQIREKKQRHLKGEFHLDGCQEIEELGKEFIGMLNDIESMNKKIFQSATDLYEMKVQKQEAELAYMRSQIDPHFLYNTLEVIRKMALVKDAPEIVQMVVDMGHIFRYSSKGSYEVPVEEEISIIKSYIRIQQMRFAGKIEVCYFVAEEVLQMKVIKMLLQPIVENSIFHGLEPKRGEGCLFIGARCEGKRLIVTVKDDGVGIGEKKLAELKQELLTENVDTSRHVGILNTNARIQLQYGREYGLTIESGEADGTTVTMMLPAQAAK